HGKGAQRHAVAVSLGARRGSTAHAVCRNGTWRGGPSDSLYRRLADDSLPNDSAAFDPIRCTEGGAVRALVADDDRVTAEILSRTLTRWTFDVTVARAGGEAWEYLRRAGHPMLAILAWMIPEVAGPQICPRVR